MSKLSPKDLDTAKVAYARGKTLREISEMVDASHEWVRLALIDAGVRMRSRRGLSADAKLSDLALEVFGDMEEEFDGRATREQLHEWLGGDPDDLDSALIELRARGWIDRDGVHFVINPEPPDVNFTEVGAAEIAERNRRIETMLEADTTFVEIAAALGITKGTVAGVAFRRRKRAA